MDLLRNSLMGRLIAAATLWVLLGLVIAGIVLASVFQAHVREQFDEELFVHLDELAHLTHIEGLETPKLTRPLSDPRYDNANSGYYWEIQQQGRIVARSRSLQGPPLSVPKDDPPDVTVHQHEIEGPTGKLQIAERAYWPDPASAPLRFIVGADRRHLTSVLSDFNQTIAWSLGLVALVMIVAAGGLIYYALRPFKELRLALENVRMGRDSNLKGAFPAEVMPLVNDLNAMLEASSDMMQRARAQAGNLAHGLKTSLAILSDEAYRMEKQGLHEQADVVQEQSRRIQALTDYHIARARAAVAGALPGSAADVAEVSGKVLNALGRLYRARRIELRNDIPAGLLVSCDPRDLNEILANLLDNAFKHAEARIRINAKADRTDGRIEIVIEDDGPGLPPEAWEAVFAIGERWDSRAGGSGLGLPIVRDLVTLYGGEVKLGASSLGGVRAVLSLPRVLR